MRSGLSVSLSHAPKTAASAVLLLTDAASGRIVRNGPFPKEGGTILIDGLHPGRYLLEALIADGNNRLLDRAYGDTVLSNEKAAISLSCVAGLWLLQRPLRIDSVGYDILMVESRSPGSLWHSHAFAPLEYATGCSLGLGGLSCVNRDGRFSVFDEREIELPAGRAGLRRILVLNTNFFDMSLRKGHILPDHAGTAVHGPEPYGLAAPEGRAESTFWFGIVQIGPDCETRRIRYADLGEEVAAFKAAACGRGSVSGSKTMGRVRLRSMPVMTYYRPSVIRKGVLAESGGQWIDCLFAEYDIDLLPIEARRVCPEEIGLTSLQGI